MIQVIFQSLVSLLLTLNASRVLVVVLATGVGSYAMVTLLMKAMRSFLFTSITFATAQSFVAYMQVIKRLIILLTVVTKG